MNSNRTLSYEFFFLTISLLSLQKGNTAQPSLSSKTLTTDVKLEELHILYVLCCVPKLCIQIVVTSQVVSVDLLRRLPPRVYFNKGLLQLRVTRKLDCFSIFCYQIFFIIIQKDRCYSYLIQPMFMLRENNQVVILFIYFENELRCFLECI